MAKDMKSTPADKTKTGTVLEWLGHKEPDADNKGGKSDKDADNGYEARKKKNDDRNAKYKKNKPKEDKLYGSVEK